MWREPTLAVIFHQLWGENCGYLLVVDLKAVDCVRATESATRASSDGNRRFMLYSCICVYYLATQIPPIYAPKLPLTLYVAVCEVWVLLISVSLFHSQFTHSNLKCYGLSLLYLSIYSILVVWSLVVQLQLNLTSHIIPCWLYSVHFNWLPSVTTTSEWE